jgi:hypothetical protein
MSVKEQIMTLSTEQLAAVQDGESVRFKEDGTELVVVRADVFDRLRQALYDDSPWTDEEMDLLAAENADALGWEGMEGPPGREPQ